MFLGELSDTAAASHAIAGTQIKLILALFTPPLEVDGAFGHEGELLERPLCAEQRSFSGA